MGQVGGKATAPRYNPTLNSFRSAFYEGCLRAGGERKMITIKTPLSQNGHTFAQGGLYCSYHAFAPARPPKRHIRFVIFTFRSCFHNKHICLSSHPPNHSRVSRRRTGYCTRCFTYQVISTIMAFAVPVLECTVLSRIYLRA